MTSSAMPPIPDDRTTGFSTHEVMNQPGALENYNAYADDKPLVEAVRVEWLRKSELRECRAARRDWRRQGPRTFVGPRPVVATGYEPPWAGRAMPSSSSRRRNGC